MTCEYNITCNEADANYNVYTGTEVIYSTCEQCKLFLEKSISMSTSINQGYVYFEYIWSL